MDRALWLLIVVVIIALWTATCLLYKAGARNKNEKYICMKFSVCIGAVFFVIALGYLMVRDESFTILESAIKYWPITLFGIAYPILNTFTFKGYVYNEVTVESPIEGIGSGASTIFLVIAYLVLGRAQSITSILTPIKCVGIGIIVLSIAALSFVRNRESDKQDDSTQFKWMKIGLGTLIFPIIYALLDSAETIVTGVCLDNKYGYGMPEGDSIIIIGMEYAIFAFGFWLYMVFKEKKLYNPFGKSSVPRLTGALFENLGIVLYSYAMAMDSVSTDPLLAAYPVLVMIGGRIIMKAKVSWSQYVLLLCIIVASIMIVADTAI